MFPQISGWVRSPFPPTILLGEVVTRILILIKDEKIAIAKSYFTIGFNERE